MNATREAKANRAMTTLENASEYINSTSFAGDAYHDASRIIRAAYGCVGTAKIVKVRVQTNGRVVAEVWYTMGQANADIDTLKAAKARGWK